MRRAEEREGFLASLRHIEEVTTNCREVQRKVLAEILSQNAETEYLKRHGLEGNTDRETFNTKLPVVTYEDILPEIRRIAQGDLSPILCAQPISEFFVSSGTSSGEKKLIPSTAVQMEKTLMIFNYATPIMNQYMPELDKGKILNFQFAIGEITTPGGLVACPFLASWYKNPRVMNRPFDPYNVQTSPSEAILCPDMFQSMYTQVIRGLYNCLEVNRIKASFPPTLLRAIRFIQLHYPDLCHDISTGTLNPRITDEALQARMVKIMRPDPELAGFIDSVCREENWEGIITRVWPNVKYLLVIVTGTMAQYIPTLDYYSGGLPKVCGMYGSSECMFGFNLNPLCDPSEVSYTIFPEMGYFEFIPLDGSSDLTQDSMPQLVELADVEVGREYEMVVTTRAGLYRYRVGDVLYVIGFHNSTPKFKIMRRENVLLSIDADKTDELELRKPIEKASALLQPFKISILEYTSYADVKTIPGHYVIYLELMTKEPMNGLDPDVLPQCCLEIEEALNWVYRKCRVSLQSIGPLEIRVVKTGTFEELMDYTISRGTSINQYKVPRCVVAMPMVELLDSRVVSTHFSPSTPHCSL